MRDSPRHHSFLTTRWTVVRRAAGSDDSTAKEALAALCNIYWYPLYAFTRRSGKSPHDAEDLTQEFFARLLEKRILTAADPAKGKMRTYLLSCLRNFLADEHHKGQALKRGMALITSFDAVEAEKRYAIEPVDDLSPDRLFQRRWVVALLGETLQALAQEFTDQGQAKMFAELKPFLGSDNVVAKSYEQLSAELGTPIGTLKSQVFRLRKRWRELLTEAVAATMDDPTPEEVRAEISELLGGV